MNSNLYPKYVACVRLCDKQFGILVTTKCEVCCCHAGRALDAVLWFSVRKPQTQPLPACATQRHRIGPVPCHPGLTNRQTTARRHQPLKRRLLASGANATRCCRASWRHIEHLDVHLAPIRLDLVRCQAADKAGLCRGRNGKHVHSACASHFDPGL